jgi:hypothetical protein
MLNYQYAFVADNPLRLIDADGRRPHWLDDNLREPYAQEALKECLRHARENFVDCLCQSGFLSMPIVLGGTGAVLWGMAKSKLAAMVGGPVAGGALAVGGLITTGLKMYTGYQCAKAAKIERESCMDAFNWVVNHRPVESNY